jgi:hypothetical protein
MFISLDFSISFINILKLIPKRSFAESQCITLTNIELTRLFRIVPLSFELFSSSFFPSFSIGGVVGALYPSTTARHTSNPCAIKNFHPYTPESIIMTIKYWCSNLSIFHDLLPVVRLLLEGPSLIPIVGILRGGVNQYEHFYYF